MWKLYQRRHLWLLIVYRFFSKFYGSFRGEGSDTLQQISPHGRKILSIDNSTSSPDDVGVVPSCIPPSLDEFPDDFFTQEQRVRGGLIVHALIIAYICLMLAIVCDKYFVPCLKVMSSYFKVPTDIAGATFMAVGASSPELFSSVIGAFVTEGDIGVGTVVGSAVFNILAVTGAAGFAVGSAAVQLDWYPITRDCVMYIITISTLVVIIHDNIVTWIESIVLILMFVGYLVVLYFNCHVQEVTTRTARHFTIWWQNKKGESMDLLPRTYVDESSALLVANRLANRYHSNEDSACPSMTSSLMASDEMTTSGESDTLAKESGHYKVPILVPELITQKYILVKDLDDDTDTLQKVTEDLESSLEVNLWKVPESHWHKIFYFLTWPPSLLFAMTIPKCNGPGKTKWFPLTFFTSIVWLGVLSYMCFWMAAVIGYTLGIPDTVSGLTILAAGTSIPELVSSVIVVRSGLGNMAMCNLLGSNIFDILFCLGVPWLAKTLMNTGTRSLVINSSALTYTTLILLCVVVIFYMILIACKWKLNWRYGIAAFTLYVAFLVIASMYESNVFGDFNPPTCNS
ncbi:sodium/potassium/calcium exchanger 5-like isoform X1 [Argiope bruennichi]|uniref:sodium/potassium/calcium exchanger 5-like isoform X1 n=1 Tax=Argiope bruennichi TaxID=94029 RepID=UPI00249593D0|nr:sodium/potassium/calcium exchanger 5-like isoform X1 [Argiope bruennichi]